MTALLDQCSREILDTVPLLMHAVRAEMRSRRSPEMSVPQFRALAFINRNPGASLSDLADHIGLSLPSASKLVDALVKRGLVRRQESARDRRCVELLLTPAGDTILKAARRDTQRHFSSLLAPLSPEELSEILQALQTLRPIFTADLLDRE